MESSQAMRITIRPFADQSRELDVTHRLIAALAEALWQDGGGSDTVNWLEAEVQLNRLVDPDRAPAGHDTTLKRMRSRPVRMPPPQSPASVRRAPVKGRAA
jgi:hypothetical protein